MNGPRSADRAGLTAGSYARQVLLVGALGPRQCAGPVERRELARLLGYIGRTRSNLNQIAEAANSIASMRPLLRDSRACQGWFPE
jgi:hypothetical protein